MKIAYFRHTTRILALAVTFGGAVVHAQTPPKMKMTTDIPASITTPDKVETRLGTLKFFDGFPDDATVEKVYDNLDFERGVQAFLTAMPGASVYGIREGLRSQGATNNNTVLIMEDLMDSKSLFRTSNTETVYNLLDGSKTYKIHLPPNIPAKTFWSFVIYDDQTRSELQTDEQFPSIGSQKKGFVMNPDTSADVYFGPSAPAGHETNWVQTVPGKGWNTLFRLYGPLQPWFDKTWKPGEIEPIN
jgi:hypothetical protein